MFARANAVDNKLCKKLWVSRTTRCIDHGVESQQMAREFNTGHGDGHPYRGVTPLGGVRHRGVGAHDGLTQAGVCDEPRSLASHAVAELTARAGYFQPRVPYGAGAEVPAMPNVKAMAQETAVITPPVPTQQMFGRSAEIGGDARTGAASTSILIVDDCTLQRENLAAILGRDGESVLAVAWDPPSFLAALGEMMPDVVLLSMATRAKISLLRSVRQACPEAKVIVVGISEDDEADIIACAEVGVAGYHLRNESLVELLSLISKVVDGQSACSPRLSAILLAHLSALASQNRPTPRELVLTTREAQILHMLELGLSNRDIADQLCITQHTVKNHVHSVLSKLGVGTRAEAAALSRSSQ